MHTLLHVVRWNWSCSWNNQLTTTRCQLAEMNQAGLECPVVICFSSYLKTKRRVSGLPHMLVLQYSSPSLPPLFVHPHPPSQLPLNTHQPPHTCALPLASIDKELNLRSANNDEAIGSRNTRRMKRKDCGLSVILTGTCLFFDQRVEHCPTPGTMALICT